MNTDNILEQLRCCFESLQSDIEKATEELKKFEYMKNDINEEISILENKRSVVDRNIEKATEKLNRLNNIFANTEENFNQVQSAAQSLLDIMASKEVEVDDYESIYNTESNNKSTSLTIETNKVSVNITESNENDIINDDDDVEMGEVILQGDYEFDLNMND